MMTVPVESFTQSWYHVAPATTLHRYSGVESNVSPDGAIRVGAIKPRPIEKLAPTLQGPLPFDSFHARTHHVAPPVAIDSVGVIEHSPLAAAT